jgi:predicted dithiol-disulfide oxidoreductase (DUF899 family)
MRSGIAWAGASRGCRRGAATSTSTSTSRSPTSSARAGPVEYNFGTTDFKGSELPGLSVFAKDEHGAVHHTYSCYSRGLDALNGAYQLLDLVPKGRDEAGLARPMEWVRHHDRYGAG